MFPPDLQLASFSLAGQSVSNNLSARTCTHFSSGSDREIKSSLKFPLDLNLSFCLDITSVYDLGLNKSK